MTTDHPAPTPQDGGLAGPARSGRAVRATLAGLAGALALSGCSLTSIATMSPDLPRRPEPAASTPAAVRAVAAAAPVAAAPPTTVAPRPRGDLAAGSVTRRLDAGTRTLVVTYWTEQDPSALLADRPTVVRLSAHLEDAGRRHTVKVTRFLATLDDGTSVATVADDRGEFVLTPPYAYGSALSLLPDDPAALTARVSLEWDLLVETEASSGAFFRQTVLDALSLTFATPAATAAAAPSQESDHR